MEGLRIEPSRITPLIEFRPDEKTLLIKGRSSPDNALAFYKSIMDLIERCIENSVPELHVIFQMEYFNTSSSRCIIQIFRALDKMIKNDQDVEVQWVCEEDDEDMIETGEDFAELVEVPINIIELEDIDEYQPNFRAA